MELNLIPIKIEIVLLNLIWAKEESLKVGIKDSPVWEKAKKLL